MEEQVIVMPTVALRGMTILPGMVQHFDVSRPKSIAAVEKATRKIVEILLAPEIEKKYSKADIMEFYCNTNFYGNHCYGVEAASRYYFGKDASDLESYEAAVLVGISNSPTAYNPVRNPEASLKKRNDVLFVAELDDELRSAHRQISEFNKTALNHMIDEGALFTMITRQTPASLIAEVEHLKLRLPVIALDGAVLYDIYQNRYLHACLMEHDMGIRIRQLLTEQNRAFFTNVIEIGRASCRERV